MAGLQPDHEPVGQSIGQRVQGVGVTIRGRRFGLPWVIGTVALVLVCATIGCCNTITHGSGGGSSVAQATATHAAPKATKAPTATPKPLTPEQQAKNVIAKALGDSNGLKVTWDASSKVLTVEHDASDNLTNGLIETGIQLDAFAVMKAAYTQWNGHPDTVIFHDNGPTQDKFGNASKGPWGTAVLNSDTAAKFNWANLDRASAWGVYDVAYYISGL